MNAYSFELVQNAFQATQQFDGRQISSGPLDKFPVGQRNTMMTSYAGTLRHAGMEENDLLSALRSKNKESCSPQLPDREIQSIAKSIGSKTPGSQNQVSLAVVRCLSDVEPEDVKWLWESRIAIGKLTLIAGNPGLGKSLMTLSMAACVTVGGRWPDGASCPKGSVLIISAEDDPADTIRPRMDAAEADVGRVSILESIYDFDKEGQRQPCLDKDIDAIEEVLSKMTDCLMLIIDPISAYMGNTDSHNNADVRSVLARLAELGRKYKIAVVVVSHLNKSEGSNMVYRVTGSLAFTAAARAAYAVVQDPDDGERRIFAPMKNNLGDDKTGFAYTISTAANNQPFLLWDSTPISTPLNDLLDKTSVTKKPRQTIKVWLRELLQDGPVLVKEIREQADFNGYSWSTVERAKKDLIIKSERDGYGPGSRYQWRLPNDTEIVAAIAETEKDAEPVAEGGAIAKEPPF